MWACLLSVHAVCLSNYKVKYWLLIGCIHLMHNFIVDCACWWTGLDACSVSMCGNLSWQFLERVLSIISIFNLLLLKMVMFLRMILRYHSVPDWYVNNKMMPFFSHKSCFLVCPQEIKWLVKIFTLSFHTNLISNMFSIPKFLHSYIYWLGFTGISTHLRLTLLMFHNAQCIVWHHNVFQWHLESGKF